MALERSIVRDGDGSIGLRFVPRERAILRALVGDLRDLVGPETPAPGLETAEDGDDAGEPDGARPDDPDAHDAADAPWTDDPALARLYPDARPDDPAWSARFRDMVRGDLDEDRRARLDVVAATLDERSLDDAQADAWLHVLNDLRLVMGARLDITEDDERGEIDPDDPDAAARLVFAYVGWLEEQLVDVLADALPPVPGEDDDPDEGVAEDDS